MPMPKTRNGCDPSLIRSALQKSIRRGDERAAMNFACEMATSSKAHFTWMCNTLVTVANEDVGQANLTAVLLTHVVVRDLKEGYAPDKENWWLPLANVIMALCRGPKSRDADHLSCLVDTDLKAGNVADIPDAAYDMHTWQGKKQRRGIEHFLTEGALLDQREGERWREEAEAMWRKTHKNNYDVPGEAAGSEPNGECQASLLD